MELRELEKKYEELGKEIEKLKSKKESKKRWRADLDETYFYIESDGDLQKSIDCFIEYDDYRYNSGNYYQTEDEAEKARDKCLLIQRYKDFILEIEEEPIVWGNPNQNKYSLYIDSATGKANSTSNSQYIFQGVMFSANENLLELAQERFTEDELRILIVG